MIPKPRTANRLPQSSAPAPVPPRADAWPTAVNAGDIARKPRQVALALQKLHGI